MPSSAWSFSSWAIVLAYFVASTIAASSLVRISGGSVSQNFLFTMTA
jgi:hypothetical protein